MLTSTVQLKHAARARDINRAARLITHTPSTGLIAHSDTAQLPLVARRGPVAWRALVGATLDPTWRVRGRTRAARLVRGVVAKSGCEAQKVHAIDSVGAHHGEGLGAKCCADTRYRRDRLSGRCLWPCRDSHVSPEATEGLAATDAAVEKRTARHP